MKKTDAIHARCAAILGVIFALWWLVLAFSVYDRKDWLLENLLAVVAVAYLCFTARRFPLSRVS
ncbi:MAG: DUF2238 domain-containing protein, partial [candidate division Zixibacteria bacterium]|nr:DUF2238 domain-containing protein [candidate division Zixibacteria bacterium]